MLHSPEEILTILDQCCASFTFPMLDNGYLYLAASRLAVYRSISDWALVIEIFGYSPRSGTPDIQVHTFASNLHGRDTRSSYVNERAYEMYLANNPNNESRFFFPIEHLDHDLDDEELVSDSAGEALLRGVRVGLPSLPEYKELGIELQDFPRVRVFELCRFLAETHRSMVLATPSERRISTLPKMERILQLEDWRHPDLCNGELPSTTETFQQLAQVIRTGDTSRYCPATEPNTHWKNWPEGGTL